MVEILENLGTPDTAAEANVVCEHGFQKGEVVRSERRLQVFYEPAMHRVRLSRLMNLAAHSSDVWARIFNASNLKLDNVSDALQPWRTRLVTVGTEHATIARFGLEHCSAACALVEIDASVSGHRFE